MSRPLAGPQTLLRSINGRAILETLASEGPQTRTDLMEATGLSRTAVTQVLRMLEAAGAVAPDGVDRSARGPAASKLGLHPHLGFAAAVHVDHRAAHVVLVDATGIVRAEAHADFPRKDDNETRVAHIASLIDRCNATVTGPLHLAVIGVPGIVTSDGSIRNDQGPDGGAFRAALTDRLGCPVRIENDVNLAALAELTGGAGAELSSFSLLLLDGGLGAGTVIDGRLHRGFSGVAGEVTYLPQTPLPVGAPVANDQVVADLALVNGRDQHASIEEHLDAAAAGDEAAMQMAIELGKRLTLVAGSIGLVLDPEAFILSGHAAHPVLVGVIHEVAEQYAARLPLRFVVSGFGPEAPLVGAVGEAASALRATLFARVLTTPDKPGR